ncbi:MAG: hypothetical protein NVS2B16_06700 [Chloroflexota bacterium]
MQTRNEQMRDELLAILAAGRELSPTTDKQLAEAFIRFLDDDTTPSPHGTGAPGECHQPHYSLQLAGGIWGAALMFLVLALILGRPDFNQFVGPALLVLVLATVLSSAVLFVARNGWHVPHVRISVSSR